MKLKLYNLIFLDNSMLLSNKNYNNWREIQEEFTNYKASLDFETLNEVVEYISFDYKLSVDFTEKLIKPITITENSFIFLEF